MNLNSRVLTSAKIGQILPIWHRECVPGDKFNVHIGTFARFAPMPAPAYVDLTFRTMSVFVPYHQVSDGVESFFANQAYFKGKKNSFPLLPISVIVDSFRNSRVLTTAKSGVSASTPDLWKYYCGNTTSYGDYWEKTSYGEYAEKILHMLGYRYPRVKTATRNFNALPLLAFAHAYNCYLSYSAHFNTSALSAVLEDIKRSVPQFLTYQQVTTILTSILLTYEESFFSSAWSRAFSSQYNLSDAGIFQSEIEPGYPVAGTVEGVGFSPNYGVTNNSLTDPDDLTGQQVRLLMKFDQYFRRTNFAGSKDVEQIYSRFGVKIDDYRTRYPYFLGESGQRVQIGDVTSTADTTDTPVGAYSGKAISSDDAGFNFECSDYGMLFTFAWYAPRPLYADGVDKECLRTMPLDFYTPELDEGFASPVDLSQINGGSKQQANPTGTFGYVPLYSEYLYANDVVAGSFERFSEFEAWHFERDVSNLNAAQSDSLIYMSPAGTEFERIFMVTDAELINADTIYMVANVQCSAVRPMKDFTGKTNLGEGTIDLPAMGSQVN